MKKLSLFLFALTTTLSAQTYQLPANHRQLLDLNNGWKFTKGNPLEAADPGFEDSSALKIDLPHTWNNLDGEDGGDDYYRGTCWYRRHYKADALLVGKRLFLQFDGANQVTHVYVNGHDAGTHIGGYAAFDFDVTPYITAGVDNIIAVSVDNSYNPDRAPLSADFTFFGGIYRPLRLVVTDPVHITLLDHGSPGVYLLPSHVSKDSADLTVTIKAVNDDSLAQPVTASAVILDASGNTVTALNARQTLKPGQLFDFVMKTNVRHPHLWNGQADPYLYRVVAQVSGAKDMTDVVEQPLGFRFYRVDPKLGFFLNDKALDLHGVCRHQDRKDQGWAIRDAQTAEDFDILKDLGATCVRLSHYQHSRAAYDCADRGGFVLWTEIPLINNITASKAFADNCASQLTELIRQNYNHPSVFYWGLYNEILLKDGPKPDELIKMLNELAHREDPSRPTICAVNGDMKNTSNWISDVNSFNIYEGWYGGSLPGFANWADAVHKAYPDRKVGVSEWGAGANPTQHQDPPVQPKTDGPFHPEEYQNLLHETYWLAMKDRPFLWWKSLWNGFDFASDSRHEGNTPGMNDKGLTTYDRKLHKDAYYWYKANWSSSPVCYITSRRYTPRKVSPTTVKVYSNCDTVELKVNGVSKGTLTSQDHRFIWKDVVLSPCANKIEAVGKKGESAFPDSCVWVYDNGSPCEEESE